MTGSEFQVSRFGRRRASAAVLFCAGLLGAAYANAAPHVPSDAAEVLERLPARDGAEWREIAALQAELAHAPRDAKLAAELAQRYLELFRAQGDPRLIAYAQRGLSAWNAAAEPPLEIGLKRAEIAQTEHRFDAARGELEQLAARAPRDARVWLTLAAIDVVRADYADARRECGRLVLLQDVAIAGGCVAAVQAMTGEADRAYQFVVGQLANANDLPQGIVAWLATLAAENADALGRAGDAETHYRSALRTEAHPSVYLLVSYADFLLRAERPREVVKLLADAPPADPLLLRLAIAEKRMGHDVAKQLDVLGYRFELALNGLDTTHAREAACFALYLADKPDIALTSALANWSVQHEAIDARLVLEAALAAGRAEAARPVLEWLDANHVEHVELRVLARKTRAAS
ncbi:MAG: hypothetical protein ABI640_14825 [Gammaproteobacteria bacterium]